MAGTGGLFKPCGGALVYCSSALSLPGARLRALRLKIPLSLFFVTSLSRNFSSSYFDGPISPTGHFFNAGTGGQKKKWWNIPQKMGGTPSEPFIHPQNPHCSNPTRTKRVSICSFFNSPSIYILTILKRWVAAEWWDKNWAADAHAYLPFQASTTCLQVH